MIDPFTSGVAIAALIRNGEVSAVAVAEAALARIAAEDGRLNSFTTVTAERALAEAAAVDAARARGDALPPLAGVPYAVKNLFDLAGVVTTPARRSSATSHPPAPMRSWSGGCAPPVRSASVRSTWTNTPTASPPRTRMTAPATTRTTWRGRPAARRAAAAPPSPAAWCRCPGQRHQRLDPGAGQPVRHLRPEADLWPAGAHRAPTRSWRAWTIWARSRATWPTSPPPGMRCRASDPADPAQGRWPVEAATPVLRAGHRRAADRRRRRPLRPQRPCPRRSPPWPPWPLRWASSAASPCPRRRARGPRPS